MDTIVIENKPADAPISLIVTIAKRSVWIKTILFTTLLMALAPVSQAFAAITAQPAYVTTNEDTAKNFSVSVTGTRSGDMLRFSVASAPTHGSATLLSGSKFKYTPATNYNGSDAFTYRVTDSRGGSSSAPVYILVTSVNDAPVATSGLTAEVATNASTTIQLSGSDVDGDALTYAVSSDTNTHGAVSVSSTTGLATYVPDAGYSGTASFQFQVSDGALTSTPQSVVVTITASTKTSSSAAAVINAVMHIENDQAPDINALIAAIDKLGAAGIPLSLGADLYWIENESRVVEVFDAVLAWGGSLDVHSHDNYGTFPNLVIYDRADVANAIRALGFAVTPVATGYSSDEVLELSAVINPVLMAGSSWQATYLWGLAEPGHTSNDTSWGITRDSHGGPFLIGGGATTIDSARAMVETSLSGAYPGWLLTSAVMLRPETLIVVDSTATVDDIIAFKAETDALGADWLTIDATGILANTSYSGMTTRVESTL